MASWVVLLGPYGLYLLFKGLRGWWRASANLACATQRSFATKLVQTLKNRLKFPAARTLTGQ